MGGVPPEAFDFSFTAWAWVLAGTVAFVMGVSKTGIPGLGILAVTVFAMIMPAKDSVGAMLPMLLVGDVFAVAHYHRKADWKQLWRVLPPAAVGIVVGYFIMDAISGVLLKRAIGGIVVLLLAMELLRESRVYSDERVPHHWLFAWSLGTLAGLVTMMSNAAGPIIIVFLLAMRLDRFQFIGTIAWYFLILNLFKVPFSVHLKLISTHSLLFDLKLAPVILLGAWAGLYAPKWIPEKPFRYSVMALAAAAAVKLLTFG
jgi:hypothetical protein